MFRFPICLSFAFLFSLYLTGQNRGYANSWYFETSETIADLNIELSVDSIFVGETIDLSWTSYTDPNEVEIQISLQGPGIARTNSGYDSSTPGMLPATGKKFQLGSDGEWYQNLQVLSGRAGKIALTLPTDDEGEWLFQGHLIDKETQEVLWSDSEFLLVSDSPAMRLKINRGVAGPDDLIKATLQTLAGKTGQNTDLLATLDLPDGRQLALPGLIDGPLFYKENSPAVDETITLFEQTLGEIGGDGDYRLVSRLYESGSRKLLASAHASFRICSDLIPVTGTVNNEFGFPLQVSNEGDAVVRFLDACTLRTASALVQTDGSYSISLPVGVYYLVVEGEDGDNVYVSEAADDLLIDCEQAAIVKDLQIPYSIQNRGIANNKTTKQQVDVSSGKPTMFVNFRIIDASDNNDKINDAMDIYIAKLKAGHPRVNIVSDQDLDRVLERAELSAVLGSAGQQELIQSFVSVIGAVQFQHVVTITVTNDGDVIVDGVVLDLNKSEVITRENESADTIDGLTTAVSNLELSIGSGLTPELESRRVDLLPPLIDVKLESPLPSYNSSVTEIVYYPVQPGQPLTINATISVKDRTNNDTILPNYPLSIRYAVPPYPSTSYSDTFVYPTNDGTIDFSFTIEDPKQGFGAIDILSYRNGQVGESIRPLVPFRIVYDVSTGSDYRSVEFLSPRMAIPNSEVKAYAYVALGTDFPRDQQTINLTAESGSLSTTSIDVDLNKGVIDSQHLFIYTTPNKEGVFDIVPDWEDPPPCQSCPDVREDPLQIWVDGDTVISLNTVEIPGDLEIDDLLEEVDNSILQREQSPKQANLAPYIGIFADVDVSSDPVQGLPVTFELVEGAGTLAGANRTTIIEDRPVVRSSKDPAKMLRAEKGTQQLAQAYAIYIPPVGFPGSAKVKATVMVEGRNISDTITFNYTARGYYNIIDIDEMPKTYFQGWSGGTAEINDSNTLVSLEHVYDPVEGLKKLKEVPNIDVPEEWYSAVGMDINNDGLIVGSVHTGKITLPTRDAAVSEPALWENVDELPTPLGYLAPVPSDIEYKPPNIPYGYARAVNNEGVIVGVTMARYDESPLSMNLQNFRRKEGSMTAWAEKPEDANQSQVADINEKGEVLTWTTTIPKQTTRGKTYLYGENGSKKTLASTARPDRRELIGDINDKGQVVFNKDSNSHSYPAAPFLYLSEPDYGLPQGSNPLKDIDGQELYYVRDINNRGEIIGGNKERESEFFPYLWRNGRAVDLNNLIPPDAPYDVVRPLCINNIGSIVVVANREELSEGTPTTVRTMLILTSD